MQDSAKINSQFEIVFNKIDFTVKQIKDLEKNVHITQVGDGPKRLFIDGNSLSESITQANMLFSDLIKKLQVKLNIVLIGRFKSGKSSFINALLKNNVAVVDITEMTYTLNYITYGENPQAIVYQNNGNKTKYNIDNINEIILENRDNAGYRNNIAKIEYLYPYKELEDINIWDTPGLGSITIENRKRTYSIINETDVVLWVMDASALGDAADLNDLNDFVKMNKPIIAIINKIDLIGDSEDNRKAIREYIIENYGDIFKEIFFCSSQDAISSINNNSIKDYELSGLKTINNYLTNNIFNNKKEITLGSVLNNIRQTLSNIDGMLNAFRDQLIDRLGNYESFEKDINDKAKRVMEAISEDVKVFINANVFDSEWSSLSSQISLQRGIDVETMKSKLSQSVPAYTKKTIEYCRGRIKELWELTVYESEKDVQQQSDMFAISNSYKSDKVVLHSNGDGDNREHMSIAVGAGATVLGVISGAGLFTSLIAGFGIGFAILSYLDKTSNSNSTIKLHNELKSILSEYKNKFYTDIYLGNIKKELQFLNDKFKLTVLNSASNLYLVMGDVNSNRNMVNTIDKVSSDIQNIYPVINNALNNSNDIVKNLFTKEIDKSDFIIKADNPNYGIERLSTLISSADRYIYIVDPYFNSKSLNWINYVNKNVMVKILLYHLDSEIGQHHQFITNLAKLREQREAPTILRFIKFKQLNGTPIHDRFIFSEKWGIQMGNGLDAIGFKDISISFLNNYRESQKNFFDNYWEMKYMKTENLDKQVVTYDI